MRALLFVFAFAVGCVTGQPPQEDLGPQVVSIAVEPSEITVRSGPKKKEIVTFTATATYDDGHVEPLEIVQWDVSNRTAGWVDDAGNFSPAQDNGGITWVQAAFDGVVGNATVTVVYTDTLDSGDIDRTLFDGPQSGALGLWKYPEDGVNIPRNTQSLELMWEDVPDAAYRLQFRSGVTDLTVFTDQLSWLADSDVWPIIAATNAGGEVEITLSAATASEVIVEPPLTVSVNRMDGIGNIYYWSTSASGIMKIPFGGESEEFVTQSTTGRCVACHVVSSQGVMAFSYDGGDGPIGMKDLSTREDVVAWDALGQIANFKTFSPDGEYLVATHAGAMMVFDGTTGGYLHDVSVPGEATHPDWSPDGTRLAFTLTEGHDADWTWDGPGRIAVMDYVGNGEFASPAVVVDPPVGWKAYYPAWSPDSEWIAYNLSTGDSYDDVDAEVWVVDGDGDRQPIRLDAANNGPELTNSWPRWGPLPDDDVLWLAFASKRDYGWVTAGNPQIWVAGFDPEKARAGDDPSWPAFWLPGQDAAQNNHIPVWVR